ncbi:MAG TPA: methylmalonyl Co-A mutase-associated GTPase MeaB [candidate division Zixibacteria bacterium]|nr:methylmalonyl Co-A mutase-associated GTPase MeaB [candidate division Zixibacteria bacterium]
MKLLEQFYKKDIRALSKIISAIEDNQNGVQKILGELFPKATPAIRIGITGPPGAGKSTLVNGLAHQFLRAQKKVGILAVDPTSPFTGGALLGDRVRMHEFPTTGEVYFRSMATRGARGGLSAATDNAAVAAGAFGYDIVLIETVGVGQIEIDIIDACDVVVVVLVPESGDSVQTMKAGLMEIGDIFVVNKSDRPGSDKMVAELRYAVKNWKRSDKSWDIPVIGTEGMTGKNIDKLFETINKFLEYSQSTGRFDSRRKEQVSRKLMSVMQNRFKREFLDHFEADAGLDQVVDDIMKGKTNPYDAGTELYKRFEKKMA